MIIKAIDEYNEKGHLIYADNYVGAFVRGETKEEALTRFPSEIHKYLRWRGKPIDDISDILIIQEKKSSLDIHEADSDVLFDSEKGALTLEKYEELRALTLRSAADFKALYESVPEKDKVLVPSGKTFYGDIPSTAEAMYIHTKNVNSYYFGEINIPATDGPDIYSCRAKGFETLEKQPDYLCNAVYIGSYNEEWSLKKLLRRFIWHDRIHAKAMYRSAVKVFGTDNIIDPFYFGE